MTFLFIDTPPQKCIYLLYIIKETSKDTNFKNTQYWNNWKCDFTGLQHQQTLLKFY